MADSIFHAASTQTHAQAQTQTQAHAQAQAQTQTQTQAQKQKWDENGLNTDTQKAQTHQQLALQLINPPGAARLKKFLMAMGML